MHLHVFLLGLASSSVAIQLSEKTQAHPLQGNSPGDSKKSWEKAAEHKTFPAPDWCSAQVTSNLGGLGPDTFAPPELRYANIKGIITTEYGSAVDVDMAVTALSGYKSKRPEVNGFDNAGKTEHGDSSNSGCFGIINLDDSEGANSVDLEFKFLESGTNTPVTVRNFEFILYDIDMGSPENASNAVEALTIYSDVKRYLYSPLAKFSESGVMPESGDLSTGVTFTATSVGNGSDNPRHADRLTPEQVDKTVIAIYKDIQKIKLTFSVTGGDGGRNFMFVGKSLTPRDPEASPKCDSGDCVIWGDPHIITFDVHRKHMAQLPLGQAFYRVRNWKSDQLTVMDEGTFWLVKSPDVQIQGRFGKIRPNANQTMLQALAVGGPFLQNNRFVIQPLVGGVSWNGESVLSPGQSVFSNDFVHAEKNPYAEIVKNGHRGPGLEVRLPNNVKLTVNRLKYGLAAKISMCPRQGQEGQCGNFNGDTHDDAQIFMARMSHALAQKDQFM